MFLLLVQDPLELEIAHVLPMGFVNSVGLAQHIHRNVVRLAKTAGGEQHGGAEELRRDRPAPVSRELIRVYLDDWDEVRKVDTTLWAEVEGVPSVQQLAVRQQYSELELPHHPKKAVESSCLAEVQGALLDGGAGLCEAREDSKVHGPRLGTGQQRESFFTGTAGCGWRVRLHHHVSLPLVVQPESSLAAYGKSEGATVCGTTYSSA